MCAKVYFQYDILYWEEWFRCYILSWRQRHCYAKAEPLFLFFMCISTCYLYMTNSIEFTTAPLSSKNAPFFHVNVDTLFEEDWFWRGCIDSSEHFYSIKIVQGFHVYFWYVKTTGPFLISDFFLCGKIFALLFCPADYRELVPS